MQLPVKLENDLILSAQFELRFSTRIPPEAVFGMLYQVVAKEHPDVALVKLPITQLPDVVRNADPNLIYQPHYRLDIENQGISIGPRILQFSVKKPYIGWKQWRCFIVELLPKFIELGLWEKIERTGLQFLNFTERNLHSVTSMKIEIADELLSDQPMMLRTEIKEGEYTKVLQLVNNAVVEIAPSNRLIGSVIDIMIIKVVNSATDDFKNQFEKTLDESHAIEKKQFFEILEKNFLKTLEPEYEKC